MASSSSEKFVFLSTLLLLIAATSSSKANESQRKALYPKVKVEIFNSLEGGSNLTLHCKSKDNDLGFHTLQPKQSYNFDFHPKFVIATIHFFCSFLRPEDPSLHYFDIYDEKEDLCRYCPWQVHKQNICGYRHQVSHSDCYPYPYDPPAV